MSLEVISPKFGNSAFYREAQLLTSKISFYETAKHKGTVPNTLELIKAGGFQGRVQIAFLELHCGFSTSQNRKHLLVLVLEKTILKSVLKLT